MEKQNTVNGEKIFSYLTRKQGYYEKILDLTEKQEEAIQSNNTKKLNLITTVTSTNKCNYWFCKINTS